MLIDEPFYAHFLSGIVRKVTDEVSTAAVGFNNSNVTLYVNEHFFFKGTYYFFFKSCCYKA